MVQIGWRKAIIAIVRNQLHRVYRGQLRGGERTTRWSDERRRDHSASIFNSLSPYLGPLAERTGLEIGPGDNLDVCQLFLRAGCRRIYAVEKYARPVRDHSGVIVVRSEIENVRLPEQVDFAYSHDVLEHVKDVSGAMEAIFKTVRRGGRFVNSIDLRGHNVFSNPQRPLDFLTCPDWLWELMFSHIVTTNRVRAHEFMEAAKAAGFVVLKSEALAIADKAYAEAVRSHLLPRYRGLSDDDLQTLQLLLVLQRPS